jgi:hypothetical protein
VQVKLSLITASLNKLHVGVIELAHSIAGSHKTENTIPLVDEQKFHKSPLATYANWI